MARSKPSETPLMRQYLQIKEAYPDAILFFRLGDFYEMFFEDAVLAANKLDLTLTSRDKGRDDGVPMAGVPHHAARGYIAKLTELGHKVVLCEQTEDPKKAKGLVKREVVRVITPGIVLDDEVLDPKVGRYVAAIARAGDRFGLAYLDASTGEFCATEIVGLDALAGELARVDPREILCEDPEVRARHPGCVYSPFTPVDDDAVAAELERALSDDLRGLGLADRPLAAQAAATALAYARDTQPAGALPLARLHVYEPADTVVLDEAAVANLELCATLIGGKKDGSLLGVLDCTRTAPGGRLLRRWLLYPLTDIAHIRRRHDAVEFLVERASLRDALRRDLGHVADLERLAGRVSLHAATPRDLGLLRDSLERLPQLVARIRSASDRALGAPDLLAAVDDDALLAPLAELATELGRALVDRPPARASDGGFIRDGYCAVVDENRRLATGGKDAILAIEARERERTGIPSLKVKYNKVFGYYIEVTRAHLDKVPGDYVRKQTVATGERYVTEELAGLEAKIVAAQDTLLAREQELFAALCERVRAHTAALVEAGRRVATVDVCAALAEVAHTGGYVRPEVDDGDVIDIVDGRHPVVERTVPAGQFVPNDCRLDTATDQILVVTGPNMAGKSTFMRQVAQIVLLAQIGSFVPARSARIGIVDRIFTRVGAADNLARGESTFMVEMRETAAILAGATRRSLVVLDEVGRGTSTFDGVSIAWAVTEYLHDAIGARTLFATHYHELCALAQARPRVRNVSVAVREHAGEIVFLRRVVEGGANRSYGIDVARLAGLPRPVVSRARQILGELEGARSLGAGAQLDLFAAAQAPPPPAEPPVDPLRERLAALDPNAMTPVEALVALAELVALARSA